MNLQDFNFALSGIVNVPLMLESLVPLTNDISVLNLTCTTAANHFSGNYMSVKEHACVLEPFLALLGIRWPNLFC